MTGGKHTLPDNPIPAMVIVVSVSLRTVIYTAPQECQ